MEDEKAISEITIAPDGRIFVFGMSKQVLDVLDTLSFEDDNMKQRIDLMRQIQREQRDLEMRKRNSLQTKETTVSRSKETNHG